jgi:hypothetical protein
MAPRRTLEQIIADLTECSPNPATLPDPLEAIVALAEGVSGLGGDEPYEPLYLDVLCPERKSLKIPGYGNEASWDTIWSCGLTARSHLRRLGVRDKRLGLDAAGKYYPYVNGLAINNLMTVAQDHGAWTTKGEPLPGQIIILGTGNDLHVRTLTHRTGDHFLSVDGGVVVGSRMINGKMTTLVGILTVESDLHIEHGVVHVGKKPIFGIIQTEKLRREAPLTFDLI